MSRLYRVHEFAQLAGVTVKALHHYERLGLLKPARSSAGYRMYSERDLERLEQIVALKFLGLPLKQIKAVLDPAAPDLSSALKAQRRAIQKQQELLSRALRAIQAAESAIEPGKPADPAILKAIIEVIDMQDGIEMMKKYYSEEAWRKRKRYYEEGPSPEWQALYRDVAEALGEDPGSEKAQALADRWLDLSVRAYCGDPEVQTDSPTAWMDREHWPTVMKQRIAEFRMEEAAEFIKQAALSSRKKYFSEEAWARVLGMRDQTVEAFSASWQSMVDLFHDIEAALGEDPASEKAQSLVNRWLAQIEDSSGGDPEVRAGLMKAWADRENWRATLRWYAEGLYRMPYDQFLKAAAFIDRAIATTAA
jgi:DNA-binding transcriptional MerR regulator